MNHENGNLTKTIVEIVIKLTALSLLIILCIAIFAPFLTPVLWGSILAIALAPLYHKIRKRVGGKKIIAAVILAGLILLLILIPGFWLADSLIGGVLELGKQIREGTFNIPAPGDQLADWPLIGSKLQDLWQSAHNNLEAFLVKYREPILQFGAKVFDALVHVGVDMVLLVISILIAGVLLVYSEAAEPAIQRLMVKLMGESGSDVGRMTALTVQNVAKGILLISFLQAILAGIVIALAGIPFPGLWASIMLVLAIIQLSPALVSIPLIVYLYTIQDPLAATIWTILLLIITFSDNLLKPYLMGKGTGMPMLVIFIGAIGGMLLMGFIGLFTGAVILSVGYRLFLLWLFPEQQRAT